MSANTHVIYKGHVILPARPTGGKAGKGHNKTSTLQVFHEGGGGGRIVRIETSLGTSIDIELFERQPGVINVSARGATLALLPYVSNVVGVAVTDRDDGVGAALKESTRRIPK